MKFSIFGKKELNTFNDTLLNFYSCKFRGIPLYKLYRKLTLKTESSEDRNFLKITKKYTENMKIDINDEEMENSNIEKEGDNIGLKEIENEEDKLIYDHNENNDNIKKNNNNTNNIIKENLLDYFNTVNTENKIDIDDE